MRVNRARDRTRISLKWVWSRLGDPAALSPGVTLLYLPFGLAGPLWIDPERVGGTALQWFWAGLFGQLLLTLVVVGGHRLIFARASRAHHPILNLLVITVAVSARAIGIAWFAWATGIIDELEIQYRLGTGLVAQTGALLFMALLVSAYSYHKRLVTDLADQRATLDQLNSTMKKRVDEAQEEIRAEVRRSIDPLIAELDRSLSELTKSTSVIQVQESIRHIVDDELRPLSHRIASATDHDTQIDDSETPIASTRISWPRSTSFNVLIRPLALGLWVVVLAASQGLRLYSFAYAVFYALLSGLLVGGTLFLVRLVIGKWRPLTWFGVGATVVLALLSVVASYQLERLSGIEVPPQLGVAAFFAVPLMSLMTALYSVIVDQRTALERELKDSIDERQVVQSVLRQREYIARQQLGYVIHGSIQASLNAAAMRLAAVTEPDMTLIDSVRADLAKAVAKIDEPISPYVQLVDTLGDIASLWAGSSEISWSMDHKTVRVLVDSPEAAKSVTEIVREGVGNAIRHGSATSVQIKISGESGRVTVSVVDNGRGIATNATPGLGSRMLEQTCVTWERTSDETGTRLRAEVAT